MNRRVTQQSNKYVAGNFFLQLLFFIALNGASLHEAAGQTFINVAPDLEVSVQPQSINFGSGISFYDFDNDGWDDLSFTMTNDSLVFYRNTGSGFERMPSFVFGDGETKHILWVDYDNDGDLDLAVTINDGGYKLYNNDGNFNFTEVSFDVGLYGVPERYYGLSFCDYDKDGYLDFYVCVYALGPGPIAYHDQNKLFRNNGDGTFTDVTIEAGVSDGVRLSFQAVWFDYDMDGWVDLFVINDRLYANSLYKNNGDGTFTDVSVAAGIQFAGQDPMTATVGDFDNDGDLDIYMTNTGISTKPPMMLRNNGDGTFTNISSQAGLHLFSWTWGAVWLDHDNNMQQDLYVCSANPSPIAPVDPNYFYRNNGDGTFLGANELFEGNHQAWSHSVARGDFNNDGYYDIAVLNKAPYDVFLWQNAGGTNNYIKMTLAGTASNSFAIGSWIKVFVNGQQYTQWTMCGENYLAQNSQHHIFGLGEYTSVDSVQVVYSLGHTDTYYNLPANTYYHFTEGETYHLQIMPTGDQIVCQGDSITLDAGEHHHYAWSNGHDGRFLTVNQTGSFHVTVTNEFGVTKTDTAHVLVGPLPEVLESVTHVSCNMAEDGQIQLLNQTGVEAAEVSWSNSMQGNLIFGLPAGWYTYLFTDANGCTAEGSVEVTHPDAIDLTIFVTDEDENQSNGSLVVFASGGTPPLVLSLNGLPLESAIVSGLTAGTYFIEVNDAEGCTFNDEVTIDLILGIGVSGNQTPLSLSVYPNPLISGGQLRIESAAAMNELIVINQSGKVVERYDPHRATNVVVNLNVPAAVYTLVILSDQGTGAFRLVVQ